MPAITLPIDAAVCYAGRMRCADCNALRVAWIAGDSGPILDRARAVIAAA